ncbi:putative ERG2 and Sigma1 receptor like protein [Leishmania naiffi]|uniref:ERG2 and Sigma1 receptor like protein n=1 Tax=Leishmania naiffi TaxID=5678 RepID=A0AAW3BJY9_9TRYP
MASFKSVGVVLITVMAVVMTFFKYVDQPSNWVYDPARLQQIAQQSIANANAANGGRATPKQITDETIRLTLENYPLTTHYTGRWLWNNAGGAMGSMTVLHCSLSEYLIIFGSSVGTEGHTGRYFWAEDFFNILVGEQWAALPGVAEKEVYRPGDQHILPRGTAKQYRMPEECWALEYARGNIISMLFFGFADLLSSTLDVTTLHQTVLESAGNMLRNIFIGKI